MANVTEISQFDAGIYQLETTDPLEGGNLGVLNKASINAANRTRWLYDRLIKLIPKNIGWFSGLDIDNYAGNNYPVNGDFTSALAIGGLTAQNSLIEVTMSNAMPSMNYKVKMSMESLGDIDRDNDCSQFVFKKVSLTKFRVSAVDLAGYSQNIKVHLEVISLD